MQDWRYTDSEDIRDDQVDWTEFNREEYNNASFNPPVHFESMSQPQPQKPKTKMTVNLIHSKYECFAPTRAKTLCCFFLNCITNAHRKKSQLLYQILLLYTITFYINCFWNNPDLRSYICWFIPTFLVLLLLFLLTFLNLNLNQLTF